MATPVTVLHLHRTGLTDKGESVLFATVLFVTVFAAVLFVTVFAAVFVFVTVFAAVFVFVTVFATVFSVYCSVCV